MNPAEMVGEFGKFHSQKKKVTFSIADFLLATIIHKAVQFPNGLDHC